MGIISVEHCLCCVQCWETFIGEQIYRLMLVNFVFMLLYTLLAECVHR